MADDLRAAYFRIGLVTQSHGSYLNVVSPLALAKRWRFRIVITANPYPCFDEVAESFQRGAIRGGHALSREAIVETVTKADQASRPIGFDNTP